MTVSIKPPSTKKQVEHKIHFMQKILKGDTYLVLADSSIEMEDEFKGLYFTITDSSKQVIQPPYEPKALKRLTTQNNILSQCIDAMEVNIDGTGWEFVARVEEGAAANEAEVKILRSFFEEPYPGRSFLSIRRELRRDIESIGYGFLECLENAAGELMGCRNILSHMIRLVRLDAPVPVTKKIERNGAEVDFTINERERRFIQKVNNSDVYYKEFGATRQLNKKTGEWETATNPVAVPDRATSLLMFGLNRDVETAYSVPRWINQLPSVVGSRKAEEQNLEFFDAGGIPPAIIFIEGGTLAKDMADQLKMYLSGQGKSNNRAVVVEAQSSSGSLESAGNVKVTVERFGAEKANDSMFIKYDIAAEDHVRVGFRLPTLFLGKSTDYNFATAKVAYMVAEAQVFSPERTEFDQVINRTLVKALGVKDTLFKSKSITLKDTDMQLKVLELSKDSSVGEGWMKELNTMAGMSLDYQKPEPPAVPGVPGALGPDGKPAQPQNPQAKKLTTIAQQIDDKDAKDAKEQDELKKRREAKAASKIVKTARDYAAIEGLLVTKQEYTDLDRELIRKDADELTGDAQEIFMELVAQFATGSMGADVGTLMADHEH